MLDALLNILNGFTDIPFVELAWSHSPDDKYGVINLDNQLALDADADPVSEKMLTGFVDVFVRKPNDLSTVSDVESAMKRLGIWFALNSVQFEDDTGYVHYEWTWRDTTGIMFTRYIVRFFSRSGLPKSESLPYLEMPVPPTVGGYTVLGLEYLFDSWNPDIVPVTQDKDYNAVYCINVYADNGGFVYADGGIPFTADQIQYISDDFPNKKVVVIESDGSTYYATNVDEYYVEWDNGKSAQWA